MVTPWLDAAEALDEASTFLEAVKRASCLSLMASITEIAEDEDCFCWTEVSSTLLLFILWKNWKEHLSLWTLSSVISVEVDPQKIHPWSDPQYFFPIPWLFYRFSSAVQHFAAAEPPKYWTAELIRSIKIIRFMKVDKNEWRVYFTSKTSKVDILMWSFQLNGPFTVKSFGSYKKHIIWICRKTKIRYFDPFLSLFGSSKGLWDKLFRGVIIWR